MSASPSTQGDSSGTTLSTSAEAIIAAAASAEASSNEQGTALQVTVHPAIIGSTGDESEQATQENEGEDNDGEGNLHSPTFR